MDATFLAAVLDRHVAALTLYARQWSVTPEDVVQEAFVKLALQKDVPEPVAPWLFRVVRNAALSAGRSERRRKEHETRAGLQQSAWFVASEESELDAATVAQLLQKLVTEPREVITLHLWGGLTFAEIAAVMDCSASSAHRWYQAGLESLRERLSPCPRE